MQQRDAGEIQDLAPGLRGLVAPNPGPMTHWGTNTFLVGEDEIAVIDPGPDSPAHLAAILDAARGRPITHILVTHAHLDHSPGARALAKAAGAPVLGFGPPEAGRRPVMRALAEAGLSGGGEGVDAGFAPDRTLGEGDVIEGAGWRIEALHTPGHFAGHLAFRWEDHLFSGDHVMDWASSLVSPPDGDLTAFMETSRRLSSLDGLTFHPGHGGAIVDPRERIGWLIAHREAREAAILSALGPGPRDIPELARAVYADTPAAMLPAAERNLFAHLIDLVGRNLARAVPELSLHAGYAQV